MRIWITNGYEWRICTRVERFCGMFLGGYRRAQSMYRGMIVEYFVLMGVILFAAEIVILFRYATIDY